VSDTFDDEVSRRLGGVNPFRRRTAAAVEQSPEVAEMRRNRHVMQKKANGAGGRSSADLQFATGRPRDPMFYWKQNNLPYDTSKEAELKKIRAFTRLLYQTHPIVGSCVDIYSKYPLIGMELSCKDDKISEFHESLFFTDDGLNYGEFLIDIGREYWSVGEAWAFGSFNESLGVWEDDE
jgi:hypothetical protein